MRAKVYRHPPALEPNTFRDTGKLWPWDAVGTRFAMLEWQARSLSEWLEGGR